MELKTETLRKRLELTQNLFAKILKEQKNIVAQWETGHKIPSEPQRQYLEKLKKINWTLERTWKLHQIIKRNGVKEVSKFLADEIMKYERENQ